MDKLGKYEIRRALGKGAMGIVYEGFDPLIERVVAIKTILPSQLAGAQAAEVMARFRREAQAAGRLNHPGIVAIYDYGEEETALAADDTSGAPQRVAYIAMEFIRGRELRDFFEKGERFALREVAALMEEILQALDHAHGKGVVHRDMKPANLIVLADGHAKIADFGIARLEASDLTQTGMVLGTPSYMSPEQFQGLPVDGRSDLFSCGVILYQLLTGEKPFTADSTTAIMYKVLREDPIPPSQLNLTLTPALDAVVKKALAKNPSERFQTGAEFARMLRAAVEQDATRPMEVPPSPAPSSIAAQAGTPQAMHGASSPAVAASPAQQTPATGPKNGAAIGVAVAAAVLVVASGAYLLLGARQPGAPSATAGALATAGSPSVAAVAPAPAAAPVPVPAPPTEPGTLVVSAIGLADSQDARFKGDMAAAQADARTSARRQLLEKVLALYVKPDSLQSHRALIDRKLLADPSPFIRTVLTEGAPEPHGSTVEVPTRAVVAVRVLQQSLNQLSRDERIDFIRNQGDPRISIRMDITGEAGTLARERSLLAENVVKERIQSFGYRVWSDAMDNPSPANAQPADFAIRGEVKLKQLSTRLPSSGLTITKTAITSWTLKAIDVATGEEVYLNTRLPSGQSWAGEDQALAEIGRLVGDEFSKGFFLQHFSFRPQKTQLRITGLPEASAPALLRELRSLRPVLDAQPGAQPGQYALLLAPGDASAVLLEALAKPLNVRLGGQCFALAGSAGAEVALSFAAACNDPNVKARLDAGPTIMPPAPAAPRV